ncbi:MAG: universal stress protein [Oligoflexales bacterium]
MREIMNILVAVDLDPKQSEQILETARDLRKDCTARVHLVHVIEPIYEMISPRILDIVEEHKAYAKRKILDLGTLFDIPKEYQFVKVGNIRLEILDLIDLIDADLLVMGNHGRHGFKGLFNRNNTSELLKNLDCDMLSVRVA